MTQALVLLYGLGWATGQLPSGKPQAQLEVFPSVTAIAPGAEFQFALRFKLTPHWHLYWMDPGDAGLPPSVKWNAPDGFEFGPLQFPVPKRHTAPGPLTTHILDGQPIFLVDVKAPAQLPIGHDVTIEADSVWLVCKENCLRESQKVSVKLPVRDDPAAGAHAEVFAKAKETHPVRESAHLKIVPSVTVEALVPGQPYELVLQLIIPDGFTIAAPSDVPAGVQPLDLYVGPAVSTYFSAPVYPAVKVRELADKSKLPEYEGRVFVRIPANFDAAAQSASTRLEGIVVFQPLDTAKGEMLKPEALKWEASLPEIRH